MVPVRVLLLTGQKRLKWNVGKLEIEHGRCMCVAGNWQLELEALGHYSSSGSWIWELQ